MKREFQAKFLQHLNDKKQDQGFSLVELLVLAIVIGILAAVALPLLLSQSTKAKQVEARNTIGSMQRAQQAIYLERQEFASAIEDLGLGIEDSTNYTFSIPTTNDTEVKNRASTSVSTLKEYEGIVYTSTQINSDGITENVTLAHICEAKIPGPGGGGLSAKAASGGGECWW
jgi:type IV pilus assembly protein PilA